VWAHCVHWPDCANSRKMYSVLTTDKIHWTSLDKFHKVMSFAVMVVAIMVMVCGHCRCGRYGLWLIWSNPKFSWVNGILCQSDTNNSPQYVGALTWKLVSTTTTLSHINVNDMLQSLGKQYNINSSLCSSAYMCRATLYRVPLK